MDRLDRLQAMRPGTFCMKPKKSAAPSQAECAEQRPKVTQVGGVTKREYCATAPLIVAFPPQSQRAIAFCTSSERCAASCLHVTPLSFSQCTFLFYMCDERNKGQREAGKEGEQAAICPNLPRHWRKQPTRRRPPPPVRFLLQTLTPGTPGILKSRQYIYSLNC